MRLTHGERLRPDGSVDMDHLRPFDFASREVLSAGQVDEVVAAGVDGEVFEPRHTTHGFQFVQIEGLPDRCAPEDIRSVVVHTDLRRTGWFTCSDDRINPLHEAAVWSFRGNACEVPTDCPQRERAGWTGDWQIFSPTAAFLYDVAGFSARWLRDLAADQWPDGRVPELRARPDRSEGPRPPGRRLPHRGGRLGRRRRARALGHVGGLRRRAVPRARVRGGHPLGRVRRARRPGRPPPDAERTASPGPHEAYLWDSGFHWGEWCEPGGNPEGIFTQETDVADVATAYLHRSASVLARTAAVLGRDDDADRWAELAPTSSTPGGPSSSTPTASVRPDTQANLVRALAFGLVPEELRAQTAARLVELIRANGTHLSTGFLATPYLLPVLADTGHADVAFELLFQDTVPSWLAMIDAGATTIWESWEGVDAEDGVGSLNHYSKGAVITFLHRYVAGIRPDEDAPGYRRFRIEPVPGGGLTSATRALDSPYGRIESSWTRSGNGLDLRVTVPPGTGATVVLPDGTRHEVGPGAATFTSR